MVKWGQYWAKLARPAKQTKELLYKSAMHLAKATLHIPWALFGDLRYLQKALWLLPHIYLKLHSLWFYQQSIFIMTPKMRFLPLKGIFRCNPGHKGGLKRVCFHILQLVQFSEEIQIHLRFRGDNGMVWTIKVFRPGSPAEKYHSILPCKSI